MHEGLSPRALTEHIIEISATTARTEAMLKQALETQGEQDKRISTLERRQWFQMGAAAAFAAVASYIIDSGVLPI